MQVFCRFVRSVSLKLCEGAQRKEGSSVDKKCVPRFAMQLIFLSATIDLHADAAGRGA
jgi:hypothetical protein